MKIQVVPAPEPDDYVGEVGRMPLPSPEPQEELTCGSCECEARYKECESRVAALKAQVKRCHAIMQGLVSLAEVTDDADVQVYKDAEMELGGEFCPGSCTTSCDADRDQDRATIAALKAEVERELAAIKAQAEDVIEVLAVENRELRAKLAEVEKVMEQLPGLHHHVDGRPYLMTAHEMNVVDAARAILLRKEPHEAWLPLPAPDPRHPDVDFALREFRQPPKREGEVQAADEFYSALKAKLATMEADYQRIIREIIPQAHSARGRPDDQLEPPWEVVTRIVAERDKFERRVEELEARKWYGSEDPCAHKCECGYGCGATELLGEAREIKRRKESGR